MPYTEPWEMSLGEFISRMKDGWGFWRPNRVKMIGRALDDFIPNEMRNVKVVVIHIWPKVSNWYLWEVWGVEIPQEMREKWKFSRDYGISFLEDGFLVSFKTGQEKTD